MKLAAATLTLSAVALLLAGLALTTARAGLEAPRRTAEASPGPAPVPDEPPVSGHLPEQVDARTDDPRLRALTGRLDQFEEKLAAMEKRRREPRAMAGDEPVDAKALESAILDRAKTPVERASALKKMRLRVPQERTLEIARSMIDLLRTCDDATVRAEVCRQLFGLEYPEVGEEMLARLRTDSDAFTREEAAETLEAFGDSPGVMQALEYAKEHDESVRVREQAMKTIEEVKAR